MAGLKPVYLVCGDDDARIDDWRARLRRRAEAEGGPGALEILDARSARPADVAAATSTLAFSTGDRYVMVDGVEAWKAGELEPLERELAAMPPATVLVLAARGKAPARLTKAVERAGGEVRECSAPKPWQLPRWVAERAREHGLRLDAEAVKALVGRVGPRPARLARELEKLAVAAQPSMQLTAEEVESMATGEAPPRVFDLADAIVAADIERTLALAEELVAREGRPAGLMFPVVGRLRQVQRAAELLDAGLPEQRVAEALKGPPWAAKRTVAQARGASREALERALCALADLELELRGQSELDDETALSLALARAVG